MRRTLNALCACAFLAGAGVLLGIGYSIKNDFSTVEVYKRVKPPAVRVERAAYAEAPQGALNGRFLMTSGGALDLSFKPALFFSPEAGCREALEAVRQLPEEKRPYLIALCGSDGEVRAELERAGLIGTKWYRCRGIPPTITVPSLVWVDGSVKKEYTCSMAVERIVEAKYPILLARAELPFVPGPADNNAIRALMSFNGAVINPGEEFSFYGYVGVPSPDRGYLPARSLMETPDGPVWFQDIGGGICKAATLLNFAVEKVPGLEVTEIHHHTRLVSYATEGKDVAVARSSGWDYRFKNSRERPVQIKAYWSDKVLKIEIWELASRSFPTKEF